MSQQIASDGCKTHIVVAQQVAQLGRQIPRHVGDGIRQGQILAQDTQQFVWKIARAIGIHAGRRQVAFSSRSIHSPAMPEGAGYGFVGPEINDTAYFGPGVGIGVRKEDTALQGEVNKALEGMFADGTFKTINLKYWTFPVLPGAWSE
ncbi:hypothetical protein [Paenirhodobacter sp.]|uniref:hypothetical protein n=1 Tax=Paenirhodobacter sp. TaxID=1965326 RepID=UPI003B3D7183